MLLEPPEVLHTPPAGRRPPDTARAPLRVADVTMFYGERSGGIRTYLEAKAEFARRTGLFEHHLVVPGRTTTSVAPDRHEQRSVRLAPSNGYRLPLGTAGLQATLRALAPDVVLFHDPYWTPRVTSRTAHELGAAVIAVHHASAAQHAAGLPGPHRVYTRALRGWYRRAYLEVDAVMSVVDCCLDARRPSTIPLRLGLDPAFRPRPEVQRGDHVLYVGRMSREKGLRSLLDAAAAAPTRWALVLIGSGPDEDALRERARQLRLGPRIRFAAYLRERDQLAREYARAGCVVLPGVHETFGLAALEAAASGARVVTAGCTPSAALLGGLVETFAAGDPASLLAAIERARARPQDLGAAADLVRRHNWDAALAAELADLRRFMGRAA